VIVKESILKIYMDFATRDIVASISLITELKRFAGTESLYCWIMLNIMNTVEVIDNNLPLYFVVSFDLHNEAPQVLRAGRSKILSFPHFL
jgi:hypothetical protein